MDGNPDISPGDTILSGKTVLVVEDDELNLKLVMLILAREGVTVIAARSAEEGLKILTKDRPHLILMDIKLEGMDGVEAIRRIKADPALAGIPVVAFSAYVMKNDIARAEEAGSAAYITKPFDRTTFLETIRKLIGS